MLTLEPQAGDQVFPAHGQGAATDLHHAWIWDLSNLA